MNQESRIPAPRAATMRRLPCAASHERSPPALHVEVVGRGADTLVFLPGLGGTTRYFASRLHGIEQRHRVILVDPLGFGDSPKPWFRYSVSRHVEALHAALCQFGPASLAGHSLGALLVVAYAARHPELVRNIAVLGMPCFGSQQNAYRYMRHGPVKGGYLFTNVVLTMAACVLTRRILGRLLPYLIRNIPREVAEDLVKHTWRSSTSSLWEVVYRYDVAADLERLVNSIGVLMIHGDQDAMAPVAAIAGLAADHPSWRLQVLAGVDHHPFLREPQVCLRLIDELVSYGPYPTSRTLVSLAPATSS